MHVLWTIPTRAIAAIAVLGLIAVGCSTGGGSGDATRDPASPTAVTPGAEPTSGDGTPTAPTEAPTEGSGGGNVGPAAAPGEGRLEVNGTTYPLTITSCEFTNEGPTKGTFGIRGTGPDGANFEMTQFYLNDRWSQTSVSLDFGATNIYVIRSGTREGAVPAAVDGMNVTWIESYRDLDVAANSQVELGEGVLNLTCP